MPLLRFLLLPVLVAGLAFLASAQDEPDLPDGLGDAPELPAGLHADDEPADEPDLPDGLFDDAPPPDEPSEHRKTLRDILDLTGFLEVRGGLRTQRDNYEKDASIGETRLHLETETRGATSGIEAVADFLYDPVLNRPDIDIEDGQGWIDLRAANAYFTPVPTMDVKIGRQILTWGTGDLLFVNDLFPKDWVSFFIGRDVEYLKAPSDAAKVSLFGENANLDVIYTPQFDPDRFITGRRISYYNSTLGRIAGRDAIVQAQTPDAPFRDDEVALRLYRNIAAYELALYGYHGFWKTPVGRNAAGTKATFPRLSVYGASVRGPLRKGIGNVEIGYYDSEQDRSGSDPLVRNSELRMLLGYEQDLPRIAKDFTLGLQYYLERMMGRRAYRRTLPAGTPAKGRDRHVFTVRLTRLLWQQNLKLSLFTFYSPSDSDTYLRPNANYKINDHWSVEVGGNVFGGKHRTTFFGQFENNSNVYAAMRYSF